MRQVACLLLLTGFALSGRAADEKPARSELSKRVEALVRQLGDAEFEKRQAAQQALLELGPDVVPLLDKLTLPEDAEVHSRVHTILRQLIGYREDIRDALEALPEITDETRPALPEWLKADILGNQPKAGDYLLTLIVDRKHPLHRRAVNAFVLTWDSMTAEQIRGYLQHMYVLEAKPRKRYPQGFEAYVGMSRYPRYGWAAWPGDGKIPFTAATTHFLDGKVYGKPYTSPQPIATTGWVLTKDLALGEHSCSLQVEYELTHQGKKVVGHLQSPKFSFSMIGHDAPDDLIAPPDVAVDRQVRKAFSFRELEADVNTGPSSRSSPVPWSDEKRRRPQVTWAGPGGKCAGIAAVFWRVSEPLPVDLCFEATLVEEKTGKTWPCDPLILPCGANHGGYFYPRDVEDFAKLHRGDVAVKVVLKPSRARALSAPEVTRYFPGTITSGPVTVRVYDDWHEAQGEGRK